MTCNKRPDAKLYRLYRQIYHSKGIAMLVLTRKRSEVIRIGDNVVIKVIRTGKGSVKLGIEAPADVRVLRGELCEHPAASEAKSETKPARRMLQVESMDVDDDDELSLSACSDQFPHVLTTL